MHSTKLGLTLGFHGCDKAVCTQLLNHKIHLKPSENDYDWLGNGMYFWENSPERALQFAKEKKQRGELRTPAVIGAVIDLGNCLNLLDQNDLALVKDAFYILADSYAGTNLPTNKNIGTNKDLLKRNLDCAVITMVHDFYRVNNYDAFDSVRGLFTEGEALYPGAGFRQKDHIQLCIVNKECIKGYFLPFNKIAY